MHSTGRPPPADDAFSGPTRRQCFPRTHLPTTLFPSSSPWKYSQAGNQKATRGKNRSKNGAFARTNLSSYLGLCSERLWSEIVEFAKFKYQFDLPEDSRTRVGKVSVIPNLCQKDLSPLEERKRGKCPLTPEEVSVMLRALGYKKDLSPTTMVAWQNF